MLRSLGIYWTPASELENLQRIYATWGVPPWAMLLIGIVMFGAWSAAYVVIIRKCFRDKTYGIPLINSTFNVTWETIFSFDLAGLLPPFFFPLVWGHRAWMIPDAINVFQAFKYGPDVQTNPFMRRHFRLIAGLTLAWTAILLYSFLVYYNDAFGVSSSILLNLLMSCLFLSLFFKRPDLRGLSYAGAWLKMIGSAAGFVFCYMWWQVQFVDGAFTARFPGDVTLTTPEPHSFVFLNFMYLLIPTIDCIYIWLLHERRKEIRAGATESRFFSPEQLAAVSRAG